MSYDLMVFDSTAAPRAQTEFLEWYKKQTEWSEGHTYDDAANTTPALQQWYREMIQHFPAMNGPDAIEYPDDSPEWDNPKMTDYTVGNSMIYVAFAWSISEEAYQTTREYAERHKVGFFDVSGNGDVIFPSSDAQ